TQLTQQAQKIVQQRDDMGSTIKKIASVTEMKSIPDDSDFLKLDAYLASKNKVVSWIEENKERQDSTNKQLCDSASRLGVSISQDALKTPEYSSELRKFSDRIVAVRSKMDAYDSCFNQIASTLGSSTPDLSDSAYSSSIRNISEAATKMKDDLSSTKSSLDSANNQLASLKNTVKDKDGNIQNLQKVVKNKEEQIDKLKFIIDPKRVSKSDDFKLWTDGSTEARMAVQGKIIDINRKYGFLVVDLGTNTKVEQAVGSKTNSVNPKIANNIDMIVARGLEGDNTQYVGKIKIVKVHDNCSIANIIPGSTGDREIKIGDTVYFSSDAIAAMNK
ncbi:MAG: hypothetical protein ACYC4Q_05985, partial [Victivallaceae bacterium]